MDFVLDFNFFLNSKKTVFKYSILLFRFPSYGNDMPYTPNYTFPNLTAPAGASDWPDYSGVDSTTNTPFEARQTPDLTSMGNSNGSSPMDTTQTGTYGIKVYTHPIHHLFYFKSFLYKQFLCDIYHEGYKFAPSHVPHIPHVIRKNDDLRPLHLGYIYNN